MRVLPAGRCRSKLGLPLWLVVITDRPAALSIARVLRRANAVHTQGGRVWCVCDEMAPPVLSPCCARTCVPHTHTVAAALIILDAILGSRDDGHAATEASDSEASDDTAPLSDDGARNGGVLCNLVEKFYAGDGNDGATRAAATANTARDANAVSDDVASLVRVLRQMTQQDPSRRPTAAELLVSCGMRCVRVVDSYTTHTHTQSLLWPARCIGAPPPPGAH